MNRFSFLAILCAATLLLGDSLVSAQPPGGRGGQGGGRQGGFGPGGGQGGGRPGGGAMGGRGGGMAGRAGGQQTPALLRAFDADGDGELSAEEINGAVATLRKLDGNKDGKLAGDELRLASPGGGGGGQQGRSGQPGGSRGAMQGGRPGGGGAPGGGGGPGGGRPGGGGGRGGDPAQADAAFANDLMSFDQNEDKALSKSELPEHMHEAFDKSDANKDGSLDQAERLVLASFFRRNMLSPGNEAPVNRPTNAPASSSSPSRGAGGGQGRGRTPIVLTDGQLPDTDAHLPDGTPIKVRDLIKGKYTVIKTGCMTCPEFLSAYKELEATAADYEKKGVQFYYIYQSLRHPEREGYVQPQNTKERLMHLATAKERLGTKVPWIADTIDDSFRVAMRTNSNSVFVIAPDSEIAYAADRMNGDGLRRALIDLVGPVENPTSASDLNFPSMPRFRPTNVTNDIRVERPQGLVILKTTPTKPEDTYYVKLRAEAEPSVLESGKGDLYLGFFPDPIHDAHWNNLTPGMKYVLELPDGVTIDPPTAVAKKGPGDSDTEPRQFKLRVDSDGTPADVKLKIHYYACSPGMCKAMTHEYTIAFKDMNRNSRTYSFNRGQGAPGGGRARPGAGGSQRGSGGQRGGAGGRGMQPGQGRGIQPGQGRGGAGRPSGGGQSSRGNGQSSRGGGPRDRVRPRDIEFNEKFPVGTQLPADLKVYNVDRELVPMTSVFKSKYTVVVGGCLTCPAYRSSYPEIEAVARDYSDQGVDFYFVYQSLAHPENWGFVQPSSIEDRFAQVEHAKELLQTKIPWLTDSMDNQVKTHFMGTPNSQFVFDQSGKVVHRDSWGRGSSLRESLESLVGKSQTLTTVQDLNLPRFARHLTPESEMLIERVRVDGVAVPLRVAADGESNSVGKLLSSEFTQTNRYVKLRPEADQQLIKTGTGKLYLGFRQDPVLGASWNNLASPPEYRIVTDSAIVSPASGQSPKLAVESDNEPREFLIDVKDWKAGKPISIQIQYFACNKDKGWCKSVKQDFTVWLDKDEAAGMVNGRTHFPGGSRGSGQGGQGRPGSGQRPGGR